MSVKPENYCFCARTVKINESEYDNPIHNYCTSKCNIFYILSFLFENN